MQLQEIVFHRDCQLSESSCILLDPSLHGEWLFACNDLDVTKVCLLIGQVAVVVDVVVQFHDTVNLPLGKAHAHEGVFGIHVTRLSMSVLLSQAPW